MILFELFEERELNELVKASEFPPAFWQWFGKSEVVDVRGQPLVVYHGTGSSFESFKGMVWASITPNLADDYAYCRGQLGQANIVPLYMRIERPFNADLGLSRTVKIGEFFNTVLEQAVGAGFQVNEQNRQVIQSLIAVVREAAYREEAGPYFDRHDFWNEAHMMFGKDGETAVLQIFKVLGFDGIQMIENGEMTFGAFRSAQVKSVYNCGKYDPDVERISEDFPS